MLAQTDSIDLIGLTPEGEVELVVAIEAGEWADAEAQQQLLAKVNGYLGYALDGDLAEQVPETLGKPCVLVVVSSDELPESAVAFLEELRPLLAERGFGLRIKRVSQQQAA